MPNTIIFGLVVLFIGWLVRSIWTMNNRITILETQTKSDSTKEIIEEKILSIRKEFELKSEFDRELAKKDEKISQLEKLVTPSNEDNI